MMGTGGYLLGNSSGSSSSKSFKMFMPWMLWMLLSISYSPSGSQVLSCIATSIRMWSTWLGLLPALPLRMTLMVEFLVEAVVLVADMVDMVLLLFNNKSLMMFLFLVSLKTLEQFAIRHGSS